MLALLSGVTLFGQITYFTGSPTTIPIGGTPPIQSSPNRPVTVSGFFGKVSKLTVTLTNMSVVPENLDVMLVAPDGKKLVFLSDSGNSSAVSGMTLTFDDAAANQAPAAGGAWVNGSTYRPVNNGSGDSFGAGVTYDATTESASGTANAGATGTLALFNGINPNGTWSLYVVSDTSEAAERTVGAWFITITPTTTTVLTSSVNPTFTSDPGRVTTLEATVTSQGNRVSAGSVVISFAGTSITSNLNASGQAGFQTSFSTEGLVPITATYIPATGYGPSSTVLMQEVNNHTTVNGGVFCNPGALTVSPSSTPYPQKIFVSGVSGTVTGMNVRLNGVTHDTPTDIDALLVSPDGSKKMVILSDTGATGDIVLNDLAGNRLPASTVAGGTFRPTDIASGGADNFPTPAPAGPYSSPAPAGSATLASTFGGIDPNGTWTLYAVDDVAGTESASISGGYCLEFTTTADPATTTTVTASRNPALTGQSVTFTAAVKKLDNTAVTTGTVSFLRGGSVVSGPTALNANGEATYTALMSTEGPQTVTAAYSGVPQAFNVSSGLVTVQVDFPTRIDANKTFCNPGSITNNSGTSSTPPQYPSRILVEALPGLISNVTVSLKNMLQAFPADFDVMLVGPNANQNFVLFSDAGTALQVGANITLSDSAANALPAGVLASGSYRPTANDPASDTFPAPAPSTNITQAAPSGSGTFANLFGNTNPNGYWSLFVTDDAPGTTWLIGEWCVSFGITPPDLSITKTHSGTFRQGQTGAAYTITVTNSGPGSTGGLVTVTDTLPAGLTATSAAGNGWSCTVAATVTCTRSDVLAAGQVYSPITVTVNVAANAAASVTNTATVSGSDDNTPGNNTASDATTIVQVADLTVSKTHVGNFTQGQSGAQYTITVSNTGAGPTVGPMIVTDTLPAGLTATAMGGSNWACSVAGLTCVGSIPLAPGGVYPPIFLTVNVSTGPPATVTNTVTVSGGGELNTSNNSASDVTVIEAAIHAVTISSNPPGLLIQVDGQTVQSPAVRNWTVGSSHTVGGVLVQGIEPRTQYAAATQNVTLAFETTALTVNYTLRHQLTVPAVPVGGGTVSVNPISPDGFYDAGTNVQVQASAAGGSQFFRYTGDLSSTSNPATVAMNAPRAVFAEFTRLTECAFVLSKTAVAVLPSGDLGRVDVSTPAGCAWTASTTSPWITGLTGAGTGPGLVRFQVGVNASESARTGNIVIGGSTLTVYQSGAGCTFTLAPSSQIAPSTQSQQSVAVTAPAGCQWTAVGSSPWLTVSSASQTGGVTLPYTVQDNSNLLPRVGTISAGGQILPVLQKTGQLQQLYTDVPPTHAFYDFIALATARGVAQPCGDKLFCPDVPLTRAEMAEFLIKGLYPDGNFTSPATPYFTDVTSLHPQFRYIQKLRELGITSGCTTTTFCPADTTNRGQMAVFVIRARLGLTASQTFPVTPTPFFGDVPATHLFFPAIQKLRELGVTTGCSAVDYCPDAQVSKGQMSVFTVRGLMAP
ncbi:MAG: S-layer homology domain-containing protein [Bryobacteraceae bacterium]